MSGTKTIVGTSGAPRVAVIIPAWRATATIGRAVASALTQTEPCHVVVVDDASPDETAATARAAEDQIEYRTGFLTVLTQEKNAGPAAARNRAIAASEAPWIALLDADDVMEPERIASLLALAEADDQTRWDMVADDLFRVVENNLDGPRKRLISEMDFTPYKLDFNAFILGNVHGSRGNRGEFGFIKPLIRRSFLEEFQLTYNESMRLGEDYDLYARALDHGANLLITNPLGYLAVQRPDSLSAKHGAKDLGGIVEADLALIADRKHDPAAISALKRHLDQVRKEWFWVRLIDAVKARSPLAIARCFSGPPGVSLSLLARLIEQLGIRGRRLLFGRHSS